MFLSGPGSRGGLAGPPVARASAGSFRLEAARRLLRRGQGLFTVQVQRLEDRPVGDREEIRRLERLVLDCRPRGGYERVPALPVEAFTVDDREASTFERH